MSYCNRWAFLLLVVGAGCAAKQTPAVEKQSLLAPAPAPDDLTLIQGTWRVDKVGPIRGAFDNFVGGTFVITGDTMLAITSEGREATKLTLRPNASPKEFDLIDLSSGHILVQGTYTLTGDVLVLEWGMGGGHAIVTLKRPS